MGVDDPRCVDAAEEVRSFPSHLVPSYTVQWISGTLRPLQTGGPLPCVCHDCYVSNVLTDLSSSSGDTKVLNALYPAMVKIGHVSAISKSDTTRTIYSRIACGRVMLLVSPSSQPHMSHLPLNSFRLSLG